LVTASASSFSPLISTGVSEEGSLPAAEDVFGEILHLPMHHIERECMMIRIDQSKRNIDSDIPLSLKL
jgi:hypothetical protein